MKFSRREALELLSAMFVGCGGPAERPHSSASRTPTGYLRTNWSQDPFSFGSYSFVSHRSPGTGEADRNTVEAPIDERIFFAGEALNPNYQSSVHAAHESGLRALRRLRDANRERVIIVGGGMAGLTAAAGLRASGAEVVVLEARDRLGGRIWTDRSLGAAVDLGATWVHGPEGNPLIARRRCGHDPTGNREHLCDSG